MIIGRSLIKELKLVLYFDTQCITWYGIDQPIKHRGDYKKKLAPASTMFQDYYESTPQPQHVHASNKCQTRIIDGNCKAADLKDIIKCTSTIDDIERKKLFILLRKSEHLFDGTLGKFETSDIKLNLKGDAKPYHAKAFPVPKFTTTL
jgi:hypothetical protein